jgi:hypothetical protein
VGVAKMAIEYTKEFFAALERLADKHPHKCKRCGIADGAKKFNARGVERKFGAVVRLALIDPSAPPNNASNVAMYCTTCRKAPHEWRTPRRIKPRELPQLWVK